MARNVTKDQRVEYLCKPENIGCAFDVYELFPKVEDFIRRVFWKQVVEEVQKKLAQHSEWKVESDEIAIWIRPTESVKGDRCMVHLEFREKELYYGVSWYDEMGGPRKAKIGQTRAMQKLQNSLRESGFQADDVAKYGWWVGLKCLEPNFKSREIFETIAENDSFARSIANDLVELVIKLGSLVKEANRAVSRID